MTTREGDFMDYTVFGQCQVEVDRQYYPGAFLDCGEPAVARIWWGTEANGLLVCSEHLDKAIAYDAATTPALKQHF